MHGAWHSSSCWNLLTPYLEQLDHHVICPDLPGHGENKFDPQSLKLSTYCEHIAEIVLAQDKKVILVGHSMSGMVISQVAEIIPEKIERLLYLSAYLPCDGQSLFDLISSNRNACMPAPIENAMNISEDKRTCSIAPEDISRLFYNRCDESLNKMIPETLPLQATLPLAGKVTLSDQHYGNIPKTYLCCLDDQVIPISHQRHMIKQQKCNEMVQLDADHSPFLSCPELLASILHSISMPA